MNVRKTIIDGKLVHLDNRNNFTIIGDKKEIDKMTYPVSCNHCGKNYDLCDVKSEHRFSDCNVYTTPCCKTKADTRDYKSLPDFTKIEKRSYIEY